MLARIAIPALVLLVAVAANAQTCPRAVELYLQERGLSRTLYQIETTGAEEGNEFTPADLPRLTAEAARLVAEAHREEAACGVGDQSGVALDVILQGEERSAERLSHMFAPPPGKTD